MDGWTIYWITRCDGIREILAGVGAVGLVLVGGMVIATFVRGLSDDDASTEARNFRAAYPRLMKILCVAVMVCGVAVIAKALVPTTKEMCAIIVLPALAQNKDAQEIGREVVDLAKDWLRELRPETPKKD